MAGESNANVGTSTLEIIRDIDNEIEDLYERIQARKLYRNNLVPISKIPVELLSYIFTLVQRNYRNQPHRDLGWIVVTHVYQRWRDIALDNPSLWVYVPSHRPNWIPEMTRRSKSATLKLKLDNRSFTAPRLAALNAFLALHVGRVGSIKIHLPLPPIKALQTLFQALPAHSAQSLQHLNLRHSFGPMSFGPMSFIEQVLTDPPRLKKLKLYGVVDWNSKMLTNLTHFVLYYHPETTVKSSPTQSEFLNALARMPTLRALHLHDVPLPAPTLSSKLSHIVHLPQLQSILLSGSPPTVCSILRYISFPQDTRLRFKLKISTDSDVAALTELFRARYPSTNAAIESPLARSLKFAMDEDKAHMTAWSYSSQDPILNGILPNNEDSFLEVDLCSHLLATTDRQEIVARALLAMCSALPIRNLTELSVFSEEEDEWAGIHAEFFAEAFGRQPDIRSVYVDGLALKALLQFIAAGENLSKETVNLPALRYLSICSGRFKKSWLSVQVLQDLLRQRNQLGMTLERVDLIWCYNLLRSDIDIMAENAHVVKWDQVPDTTDSSDSCESSTSDCDEDEDSS